MSVSIVNNLVIHLVNVSLKVEPLNAGWYSQKKKFVLIVQALNRVLLIAAVIKSVPIALHLKTSSILLNTNDNHVTAILLLLILNA